MNAILSCGINGCCRKTILSSGGAPRFFSSPQTLMFAVTLSAVDCVRIYMYVCLCHLPIFIAFCTVRHLTTYISINWTVRCVLSDVANSFWIRKLSYYSDTTAYIHGNVVILINRTLFCFDTDEVVGMSESCLKSLLSKIHNNSRTDCVTSNSSFFISKQ